VNDEELIATLDRMRNTLVAVATGGPRIQSANAGYQEQFRAVDAELSTRSIENPVPFSDLWQWYGRWSQDDLPTYQSRRDFVAGLFVPVVARIRTGVVRHFEETGWERVDRTLAHARDRLAAAKTEEQFQAVGLLCREALISLAQAVFDADKHPIEPGVRVSETDFKRMIDAYLSVELGGSSFDEARRHAKTALDLSLRVQHQRTATFRDAAICLEATASVVNIIAILSGRRDPNPESQPSSPPF
jgi:hypothetical protein